MPERTIEQVQLVRVAADRFFAAIGEWADRHGRSNGRVDKKPRGTLVARALEAKVIDEQEEAAIHAAEEARDAAVQVDAFDPAMADQLQS